MTQYHDILSAPRVLGCNLVIDTYTTCLPIEHTIKTTIESSANIIYAYFPLRITMRVGDGWPM